jgi:large subunit ribosomal protein L29
LKRLKSEALEKLETNDLRSRLEELRLELSRLRSAAARGTIKKETGEIRAVRRNIARILTVENRKTANKHSGEKKNKE